MGRSSFLKKERQHILKEKIKSNPFCTDEELSELLSVSVPTIRLDRMELGIPELRERIKSVAENNYIKANMLHGKEIIGELIDINFRKSGVSVLETNKSMAFDTTNVIKGQYIYSLAESLAIAVIDTEVALVGVANIKYTTPVYVGSKLTARAEVRRIRGQNYLVWVRVNEDQKEVFRAKFILVSTCKKSYTNT